MSNFLKRKIKKDEKKFKRKSVKVNDLKLSLSFIWFYPAVLWKRSFFIFPNKESRAQFKEIIILNAAIKKFKMPKMMAGYLVNKKKEPKNKNSKKEKVFMI